MKKNIILLVAMSLTLSGCGIYTKYKPATSVPDDLYGGEVVTEDTAGLGNMDWRELFTDPHLQSLIEDRVADQYRLPVRPASCGRSSGSADVRQTCFPARLCAFPAGDSEQLRYEQGYAGLLAARDRQLGTGRIRPYAQLQEAGESAVCTK